MRNSIYHSEVIFKLILNLKLEKYFRRLVLSHIMTIICAVFSLGYRGKTTQMSQVSEKHRTTIAHFLNHGRWDDNVLEQILKAQVVRAIHEEAERTGKPVICIVDDTIASKTKPSSKAMHPIEAAYFHQSHIKKKQDYGHQAVGMMLACNGIVLNYANVMYDKSRSKIQIVCDIANELPVPSTESFLLCDCWYSCVKVMDAFLAKGFHTIGARKTNRVIFPAGIRQQIAKFAQFIRKTDSNVNLVTVGKRQYYVFRYEGKLNDLEDVAVLISYPKGAFGLPHALRAFICTDCALTTQEILDLYLERWSVEVFFRQAKQRLALDKYQIRTSIGIRRFWLLMSLAHYICCFGASTFVPFQDGLLQFKLLYLRSASPTSISAELHGSRWTTCCLSLLSFVHSDSFARL